MLTKTTKVKIFQDLLEKAKIADLCFYETEPSGVADFLAPYGCWELDFDLYQSITITPFDEEICITGDVICSVSWGKMGKLVKILSLPDLTLKQLKENLIEEGIKE